MTEFTNTTSNRIDSLSDGLSNGTTTIDGGCIKTGMIDAQRISLKGLLSYQYSVDGVNDWHYPMEANDVYRRETIDGGKTWGDVYRFVGKDGKDGSDGSDANLPSYIELKGIDFTEISSSYIKSPKVYSGEFYGTEFNVIAGETSGSFNLYGLESSTTWNILTINYANIVGPEAHIYSPCGAAIYIGDTNQGRVDFYGIVDFSLASVSGLTATFA